MIGNIIGNVDGITVVIDVGTELFSLDAPFDNSKDGKLQVLLLVESLGYTYGKVLGSDEGIKLGSTYVKVLGTILEDVDGIIPGLDVETDLGYLDVSFDCSNDGKLEGLLIGESLGYTDGKVLITVLGNVDGITVEFDVGKYLVSLDGSFDGSNDGKLKGLLIGGSLGYTDVKVIGSD